MTRSSRTPLKIEPARRFSGPVSLPGDKSISHRYGILAALAEGATKVVNYSPSEDCQATLDCLAQMGAVSVRNGDQVVIEGVEGKLSRPDRPLDVGNSGTSIRLLAGVLAAQPFTSVIQGDDSLSSRPMKRIMVPLTRMGAKIEARDGGFPPLVIEGATLRGIDFEPPMASAQVKSCVLLAGVLATGQTVVREAVATRDHTERALPVFGVEVRRRGSDIQVTGPSTLSSANVIVPGDFSAAAFFLLGAALCPGSKVWLTGVGVNPTRTGLLRLLEESGVDVSRVNEREVNGEPVCDLHAGFSEEALERFPSEISGAWIPNLIDEIPALAVFGVRLKHGFTVRDASELRRKESDRIRAVTLNLRALGIQVDENEDGFHIPAGQTLRGGAVQTFGDHRIAMAFAIASLIAEEPIELDDPGCAAVSFPAFFEEFLSRRPVRRSENVFLVGFMGSGKSTVGPALAAALGLPFVDLDESVERERGASIAAIFESCGEPGFREVESRLLERLVQGGPTVVAVGGGTFVSEANRRLMRSSGTAVWLDVSLEVAWDRCGGDPSRPLAADFDGFERLYRERRDGYALADIHVEANSGETAQIVAEIVRRLDLEQSQWRG